jgi:hypothetical protein
VLTGRRPYDEACDEAGRRRPRYVELARRLGWDPLDPPASVAGRLRGRPLGDDTPIVPVPVALDDAEWRDAIQPGVAQRARALQAFFADVVLGLGRFLDGDSGLGARLLDEVLASEGTSLGELRRLWRGRDREAVSFVYAPDLMREPGGRWQVIEDNVGCVTGCVDGHLVLDRYRSATGRRLGPSFPPDLGIALERWLGRLELEPSSDGVVALMSDGAAAHGCGSLRFREDDRRRDLVARLGVRVVDDEELERRCAEASTAPPVRAVANIGVPSSPRVVRLLTDEVFGRRRVPFLNAPGTTVLGSKALLPFVGAMVRHYDGAELALDAPPTVLLRDGRLPEELDRWVLKAAAGCQGNGVVIGRSQPPEQVAAVAARLDGSWPARAAVAQRNVEPSRLRTAGHGGGEYVVEVRALAYVVGWQDVVVGEHGIAKLAPHTTPATLNNLTRGGAYAPVVRVGGRRPA